MRKLLVRILIGMVILDLLVILATEIFKRRMPSRGDEQSDEVALVTIRGGRELRSRATSFRGGSVLTVMGGTRLDLRGASPVPDGAHLRLRTYAGGTEVVVPDTWRVQMEGRAIVGGHDVGVPRPDRLPENAPRLSIEALTLAGGTAVSARAASQERAAAAGEL